MCIRDSLLAIVLSVLPVLLLRVWHPYTSAFMLRADLEARAADVYKRQHTD